MHKGLTLKFGQILLKMNFGFKIYIEIEFYLKYIFALQNTH